MDTPTTQSPTAADPPAAGPPPAFTGRTPSKSSAIRAGVVLGTALVVAIGAAVAMGASVRPTTSGAGPLAAASGSAAPEKGPKGHGFGHGGFGGLFGGLFGGKGAGHGRGHVTIASIEGASVDLATDDGWTRTITLTDTTTITRGGAAATKADLHVGDAVRFHQQKHDDGTFAITAIDVVLPQVLGTVTSTAGDTLTIKDRDGASVTVHVSATTRIRVRGVDNATAKDVSTGQVVLVVGERRADGSIDATGILSGRVKGEGRDKPKAGRPDGSDEPEESDQPG